MEQIKNAGPAPVANADSVTTGFDGQLGLQVISIPTVLDAYTALYRADLAFRHDIFIYGESPVLVLRAGCTRYSLPETMRFSELLGLMLGQVQDVVRAGVLASNDECWVRYLFWDETESGRRLTVGFTALNPPVATKLIFDVGTQPIKARAKVILEELGLAPKRPAPRR